MNGASKNAKKTQRKNKLIVGENKLHLMDQLFVQAFTRLAKVEAAIEILEARQQALVEGIEKVVKKAEPEKAPK